VSTIKVDYHIDKTEKIKDNIKENKKDERKEKMKKTIRNLIIFIILIILTFYIILKDQNIVEIFNLLINTKKQYILIAVLCMCIYIVCESINIGRVLKTLNEKTTFLQNIKYALIGFFFSSITPAASGGQPMQIYYMHKDKIKVAHSTLALLINLTSTQITTIMIAVISLLFNYKYLNKILIILFVVGIMLNMTALMILMIGIFSKRLSKWLIKVAFKFLKIFKAKNLAEKKRKIVKELLTYQASAKYIKANKKMMLKILCTTIIQFLIFYSIAYWTYRAFGFTQNNIIEITTMQSVLYATVSGIPSPGAVGVSEGAFVEIFRNIYPEYMIKSATLLNRGINFYLFVIISSIVVVVNDIKVKK
jgi:hypothetical protein